MQPICSADADGWSYAKLIARTIMPWTSEWLRVYEIWLVTNNWFGPEASHQNPMRELLEMSATAINQQAWKGVQPIA